MKLKYLFWIEVLASVSGFCSMFFFPATMLAAFGAAKAPPLAQEMTRWYAALLPGMACLELWALLKKDPAFLKMLLRGMALNDLLQLYGLFRLAELIEQKTGTWWWSVSMSTVFFLARLAVFIKPALLQKPDSLQQRST